MTGPASEDADANQDRRREQGREWRERNRDLHHAANREWKAVNFDRARELNRENARRAAQRRKAHEEKKARMRAYYREHADERRAYSVMYVLRRRAEDPEGYQEQRRAAQRAWYRRHRDEILAREQEKYRQYPQAKKEYAREYYQRNKDTIKAQRRAYYQRNKDVIAERQRAWNAAQRARKAAGLPKRILHGSGRPERLANQQAADDFFTRHRDAEQCARLWGELRTPPEVYAAWQRDCLRARAAHHAAVTPPRLPQSPTPQEIENARLDEIARAINDRLRTGASLRADPRSGPDAPLHSPHHPQNGLSR